MSERPPLSGSGSPSASLDGGGRARGPRPRRGRRARGPGPRLPADFHRHPDAGAEGTSSWRWRAPPSTDTTSSPRRRSGAPRGRGPTGSGGAPPGPSPLSRSPTPWRPWVTWPTTGASVSRPGWWPSPGPRGRPPRRSCSGRPLAGRFRVHATTANLNNRVGVPLTLLSAPADAQVVVVEVGTSEPGEIAALRKVAHPDVAVVIATVSEAHVERLGDLEGVFREKLDLVTDLPSGPRWWWATSPPNWRTGPAILPPGMNSG
jgi:hypothetical protein